MLAEQVGFGLFLEGGFKYAGAGASHAARVCQADVVCLSADVLMHSEQSGDAGAAGEHLPHAVPRRFGGDHGDVHAVGRLYRLEVYVEAVREHERLAGEQVGQDGLAIDLRLDVVGNQHHHDVGLARGVLD